MFHFLVTRCNGGCDDKGFPSIQGFAWTHSHLRNPAMAREPPVQAATTLFSSSCFTVILIGTLSAREIGHLAFALSAMCSNFLAWTSGTVATTSR